jgi:putative aminopeptidase FrvX
MNQKSRDFLEQLLTTPSPTGRESEIQKAVRSYISSTADEIRTDLHGNLIASINPKASRRVMLAGHCDQIALVVKHISKDGFLSVAALGGIDVGVLYGASVQVLTEKKRISGVIGRKPIHLQSSDERSKTTHDIDKVWIDIGAKDKKDAEQHVEVGDAVIFTPTITHLLNNSITGPGLDNRVGLYVVIETLRRLSSRKLSVGVYSVSTVQEEVGLRGAKTAAFSIDPEIGIAVDVTHANDNPGNENSKNCDCKLGAGPTIPRGPNINPVLEKMLRSIATKKKIPHQIAITTAPLGNDANAIQLSRGCVATAALGIPNRHMHTQAEVCNLDDLEHAVQLLTEFIVSIKPKMSFTP